MKTVSRIPISDLRAGMLVTGFDKPEIDYPYYNSHLPDDEAIKTLILLKKLDVKYAYVTEDTFAYLLKPAASNDQNIKSSNQDDTLYTSLLKQISQVVLTGAIGQGINIKSVYDYIIKTIGSALQDEEVAAYMNAIRSYDLSTFNHSIRVAIYAVRLSIELGMMDEDIKELVPAGLLHDIGKLSISNDILNKPDKLDIHEFSIMQSHPVQSYEILKRDPIFSTATLLAVKHHHERSNGSGYPSALAENEIPLFAKILALSDVYDAITSRRVYSKGLDIYDAISFINSKVNDYFNRKLIDSFIKALGIYTKGTTLLLDTSEHALVFEENKNTSFPQQVLILTDSNGEPLKRPFLFDLNKKDEYGIFIKSVSGIVDIDEAYHGVQRNISI